MISVIIPVYNSQEEIEACVRSILTQSYKDFELILVDDGSKDKSYKICDKLAKEDKRIRLLKQTNQGASVARNNGIKHAKGEYIIFVDSDDSIASNTLELAHERINKDKSDLVIWGILEHNEHSENKKVPRTNKCIKSEQLEQEYPEFFRDAIIYSPCNKLYKKDLIKVKFAPEVSLGEDFLFNLNYIKETKSISFIDKILYLYNNIGEGLNNRKMQNSYENSLMLHEACRDFQKALKLGHDTDLILCNNLVASFNYNIRDFYQDKNISNAERKAEMKRWLDNDYVKYAIEHAEMPQNTKAKTISLWLLRHKSYKLFHLLLSLRGKL